MVRRSTVRRPMRVGVALALLASTPAVAAVGLSPLRFHAPASPFVDTTPDVAAVATNTRGDAVVAETVRTANGTLVTPTVRYRNGARGAWSGQIRLARPASDTTDPVAALNARGHAIVVFARNGRYVASRRRAGTWALSSIGAPAPTTTDVIAVGLTSTGLGRFVQAIPDTGCDPGPTGCAWTVAIYDQAGPGALWIRQSDTLRIPLAARPAVDLNRSGDLLVAWITPGGSARVNASRKLATDASFEAPLPVSPPGVRGDVHGAIGDGGDAVIGWAVPDATGTGTTFTGKVDVALRRVTSPIWSSPETVLPAGAPNPDIALDIDAAANVAVAWTTLGSAAGSPTALDATYRAASDGTWSPSPRLDSAAVTDGEALILREVRADGRRAFVHYLKDTGPGGDLPRLSIRSRTGAWTTRGLAGNANPTLPSDATLTPITASSADGDLILVSDGIQVRNFDAVPTASPARASDLRVAVAGRSATLRFRLNVASRVHVLRRSGVGFRMLGEYLPARLAGGAQQFRLGSLPVGRYLVGIGACNAARGCTATPSMAFRIR